MSVARLSRTPFGRALAGASSAVRTLGLLALVSGVAVSLASASETFSLPRGTAYLTVIPIALAFRFGARWAGYLGVAVVAFVEAVLRGGGYGALFAHLLSLGALAAILDSIGHSLRTARHRAVSDHLTNVRNRRGGEESARDAMEECRLRGMQAVLVLVDCDRFKAINDVLGHAAGDRSLKEVARALRTASRKDDVIWRHGGDEFAVFLVGADLDGARAFTARVESSLARASSRLGVNLSVSTGSAVMRDARETLPGLIARADHNLYQRRKLVRTSEPTLARG